MNPVLKKVLKNLAFLAVGVLLLWWAFRDMKISEVAQTLQSANYSWVVAAMLCGVLAHFIRALRWRQLIHSINEDTSVKTAFNAVMIAYLFNFIVPRMGEISRCAVINRKDRVPLDKLIGTVITERLFDLVVMGIISVAIYITQFNEINYFLSDILPNGPCSFEQAEEGSNIGKYILFGLAGLFVVALAVLYIRNPSDLKSRAREFIVNAWEGIWGITKLRQPWLFLIYTAAIWTLYFLMSYLIFFSLPATSHLGVSAGLFVLLLGTLAIIVPVPGGIGTFHAFVAVGLTMLAIDCSDGMMYATISHGAQMLMIFVVGGTSLLFVTLDRKRREANEV